MTPAGYLRVRVGVGDAAVRRISFLEDARPRPPRTSAFPFYVRRRLPGVVQREHWWDGESTAFRSQTYYGRGAHPKKPRAVRLQPPRDGSTALLARRRAALPAPRRLATGHYRRASTGQGRPARAHETAPQGSVYFLFKNMPRAKAAAERGVSSSRRAGRMTHDQGKNQCARARGSPPSLLPNSEKQRPESRREILLRPPEATTMPAFRRQAGLPKVRRQAARFVPKRAGGAVLGTHWAGVHPLSRSASGEGFAGPGAGRPRSRPLRGWAGETRAAPGGSTIGAPESWLRQRGSRSKKG